MRIGAVDPQSNTMMRLIAAVVISSLILGGLGLFIEKRDRRSASDVVERRIEAAEGKFSVDVTLSFSPATSDPFAVATERAEKKPVVVVRLNGSDLLSALEAPPAGELISIEKVDGVNIGENEFLVEADPPLSEANRAHAVRVRVLRDGQPIAEQTTWSEPGTRLVARFRLNVPAAKPAAEHTHD